MRCESEEQFKGLKNRHKMERFFTKGSSKNYILCGYSINVDMVLQHWNILGQTALFELVVNYLVLVISKLTHF